MTTTIALGNCPSSGSTFLADLLDSSPISASGPELNLFSLENLYNGNRFRDICGRNSKFSSIYLRRNGLVLNDLASYGLNENKLNSILNKSSDLKDFLDRFAQSFLAIRGKSLEGVVFEKSPQNIHCVGEYLKHTDNYFIHIVRNPINVYKSLLCRSFSAGVALSTWLLDESKMFMYLDHPRVIIVKYEDLIEDPFTITSGILHRITGQNVEANVIEDMYKNNAYRKYHTPKLESWTNKSFGSVGVNKKKEFSREDIVALSSLKKLKVNSSYAEYFNLSDISFLELAEKLGYLNSYLELVVDTNAKFQFSHSEKYKLFRKFTGDVKHGDARVSDCNIYLKPVEEV